MGLRFLLFFSLFFIIQLSAQDHSKFKIPCDNMTFLVKVHEVKEDKYKTFMNPMSIDIVFASLNNTFNQACIKFVRCDIDSIQDYNYYQLTDERNMATKREEQIMVDMYYEPRVINLFLVSDLENSTFNGICMNDDAKPNIISLNPNVPGFQTLSFIRNFLVFFGLKSTDFNPADPELVNTSNGAMVADSAWDTPADPLNLLPSNPTYPILLPILQNDYYYYNLKDANGDYYDPMIYNIMCPYGVVPKCTTLTHMQAYIVATNAIRCRANKW